MPRIFRDTNAQSSIRTRIMNSVPPLRNGQIYEVEYVPRSGRSKGKKVVQTYIGSTIQLVVWLSDVVRKRNGQLYKLERTGTLWDDIHFNNVGREGGIPFPNGKKPIELIKRCVSLADDKDGSFLDFFAGSGSTAHAVIDLNKEDGGNRKFILVELPEPIEESEYSTTSKLCIARVRNVVAGTDYGFRVFKLSLSNFLSWDVSSSMDNAEELARQLKIFVDNVRPGRSQQDLLYELILKSGLPLTSPVEKIDVHGQVVFSIASGTLLICLESTILEETLKGIVKLNP